MIIRLSNIIKLFLISVVLASCTPNVATRVQTANTIAAENQFQQQYVKGGDFVLTTYQRITDKNLPYVFYIESDGHISEKRYANSENPTPIYHMLLKLAALDKRPNVVYIARPCQYTPLKLNPKCKNDSYWLEKRMSKEVVDSVNEVINTINNGQKFSLVGFSGGGGIAVISSAENKNVKDIVTIAANLDIISFNTHNRNNGFLSDSLNPIEYATRINNIPQLHFSGADDKIVPASIAQNYVKASNSTCVKQRIIPNTSHTKGWDKVWTSLLKIDVNCN